jgi:hypothetical protein
MLIRFSSERAFTQLLTVMKYTSPYAVFDKNNYHIRDHNLDAWYFQCLYLASSALQVRHAIALAAQ